MSSSSSAGFSLFTTAKFTAPMFKGAKGKEPTFPNPRFLKYLSNQPDL
jgi:hypothetical protein